MSNNEKFPFTIHESKEIEKVRNVMNRLYTEDYMNGNEMRDLAQQLQAFIDVGIPYRG